MSLCLQRHYFFLFYFGYQTLYGTALQHDDARPHTARHTTKFLANNEIKILSWPSMSTDLNPNKHTWNELERRAPGRVSGPANVRELFQALKQEWVAISEQVIHNLIQSMPKGC